MPFGPLEIKELVLVGVSKSRNSIIYNCLGFALNGSGEGATFFDQAES